MGQRRGTRYDAAKEARAIRFATELADALHELGITHKELAQEMGVSVYSVDSWTRGVDPAVPGKQNLDKLCAFLDDRAAGMGVTVARAVGHTWEPPLSDRGFAVPGPLETSPPQQTSPPTNLPLQLSTFIGREREIAEVGKLLTSIRLLTLTGAGGIGKTRLSWQVASNLKEAFADGVWMVELAPLADAALLPQYVSASLGVQEQSNRPVSETLREYLRDKHLLLVLDNCEHLVDACADFVTSLLPACPRLTIMATSREALRVPGETLWRVPPLTQPGGHEGVQPEDILEYEAVRLFSERARSSHPGFGVSEQDATVVAAICRRLDGMPLAIELAAANTRFLSLSQIAERLDRRFQLLTAGSRAVLPRHQTLEATIAWSHDLLTDAERVLFRRLAVFAGGWTLEAVESVCLGDGLEESLVSLLGQLVDKSLVIMEEAWGEARYHMLETIREYALAKLTQSGERELLRERHAAFYLQTAQAVEYEWHTPQQVQCLRRLDLDLDNMRATMEWSLKPEGSAEKEESTQGRSNTPLLLVSASLWFWYLRGHYSEGRGWLERGLAATEAEGDTIPRANGLYAVGALAWTQGDYVHAADFLQAAVDMAQRLGDTRTLAYARNFMGLFLRDSGDFVQARSSLEQSMALWRKVGDKWGISWAIDGLGSVLLQQGDYDAAKILVEEAMMINLELDSAWDILGSFHHMGNLAYRQGEYEAAHGYLQQAMKVAGEVGDKWMSAGVLNIAGQVARCQGDYRAASTFLAQSLGLRQALGDKAGIATAMHNLAYVAQHKGDIAEALTLFRESMELRLEQDHKKGIAECLVGLAGLAALRGGFEKAVRLYAVSQALFESAGVKMEPANQSEYEQSLQIVHRHLDEATFNHAWAEGATMTVEIAVKEALDGMDDDRRWTMNY